MKITIDCDLDERKLDWALRVLSNDLLPWEEDMPESMEGGQGEALTVAIDCLEKMRQGIQASTPACT